MILTGIGRGYGCGFTRTTGSAAFRARRGKAQVRRSHNPGRFIVNTVVQLRLLCLAMAYVIPASLASQESTPAPPPLRVGPPMERTAAWIKRNLPLMGSDRIVTSTGDHRFEEKHQLQGVALSECQLRFQAVRQRDEDSKTVRSYSASMKSVDPDRLRVSEEPVPSGWTRSKPSYFVWLFAAQDHGKPFTSTPGRTSATDSSAALTVRVRDQEMALRAINAFRNAAVLCGAASRLTQASPDSGAFVQIRYVRQLKNSDYIEFKSDGSFFLSQDGHRVSGKYTIQGPIITIKASNGQTDEAYVLAHRIIDSDFTAWGSPSDSLTEIVTRQPTREEVPGPKSEVGSTTQSRITNLDVLQLVAAGLSDSVVATAIRQAAKREFDLTPAGLLTLKKGRVSDGLISVMQGLAVPAQAVAPPPPPPPPRYDPSLKNPVTPPVDNACSGIENLGLFKNQVIPNAMGGVVQWLIKLRNNTPVTKIVVFGWINMYGEQKKAQIQIGGGQIATAELDVTEPRLIAPVRDLRVISCQ